MGYFIGDIEVTFESDGRYVRVDRPFSYVTSAGVIHTVPTDFRTDGASIPKGLWWLIGGPFSGRYRGPAIVHDRLYFTGEGGKRYADKIFREAMQVSGVSFWKRNILYRAVRWFGYGAWNAHRERDSV